MGNGYCCEETKKFDEDFDVKNILTPEVDNFIVKRSFRNTKSLKTRKSYQKNETKKFMEKEENLQNEKKLIKEKNEERKTLNWMKLLKHISFRKTKTLFSHSFIKELDKARTDFLGFSQKLMDSITNFDSIQNKINEISEKNTRNKLSRTKEDFKMALDFFEELQREKIKGKKKDLNELIEIDDLKLPIPSNRQELNELKYHKKFVRRFNFKFNKKFKINKMIFGCVHEDPQISFLLYITKDIKNLRYLFDKEIKYFGMDFEENFNGTIFITVVLASDY